MNSFIKIKKKQTKYYNYSKINTYRLIANEITRLLKRKKYLKLLKQKKNKRALQQVQQYTFRYIKRPLRRQLLKHIREQVDYETYQPITIGEFLCKEKYVTRFKLNSSMLGFSKTKSNKIGSNKLLRVKTFNTIHLFTGLININQLKKQKKNTYQQYFYKLHFPFGVYPYKWINNKGLIAQNNIGSFFNPYSKTPSIKKNKNFSLFLISKIKELSADIQKNQFSLTNIKYRVWTNEISLINSLPSSMGTICTIKNLDGFIVGVQGVPVFLYRNQLNLSLKKMKKKVYTPYLLLGDKIETSIYEIIRIEKRINIQLQKKIYSSKPNYKTNVQLTKLYKKLYNTVG